MIAIPTAIRRMAAALLCAVALDLVCSCRTFNQEGVLTLRSPDGAIAASIQARGAMAYSIDVDGRRVLNGSRLGLHFSAPASEALGEDARLIGVSRRSADRTWENRFGKRRVVRDHFNELLLSLREKSGRNFQVIFRAYNDGVAFRYVLPESSGLGQFSLDRELTDFTFADDYNCFAGEYDDGGFKGPQEWQFMPRHLSEITTNVAGLPLLVQTPGGMDCADGIRLAGLVRHVARRRGKGGIGRDAPRDARAAA